MVEDTLRDFPETRNSDISLMIKIWSIYYPQKIYTSASSIVSHHTVSPSIDNRLVCLNDLFYLPSQDAIKRWRAKIQNEEYQYIPTEWAVARRRNFEEQRWREALGYKTAFQADGDQFKLA